MEYRSPLDNVINFISGLPQGHDKPVKHAIYNAIALFAIVLCCAASYALYVILGPFMKPLIWALLVGSVLHPFKYSLARKIRSWFASMEKSHTPIFFGVFIVPVNIIDDLSEFIGSNLVKYMKYIIGIGVTIPLLHVVYNYTPRIFICLTWKIASFSHSLITFIISNTTPATICIILVGYISLMAVLWSPKNNNAFHYASIIVWLLLSCFLAHQFGLAFQTPIFIAMQVIFLIGFVYEIYNIHEALVSAGHEVSLFNSISMAFHSKIRSDSERETSGEEIENVNSDQDISADISDETASQRKTSIKFGDSDSQQKDDELPELSTPKKKDPWSLDLFESKSENINKDTKSRSSNVQFIKQPSELVPSVSEIFHKRDPSLFKFHRSHSQPYVSTYRTRSNLSYLQTSAYAQISSTPKPFFPTHYASDFYLYSLLWACGIMAFWKNVMMIPVLVIPIMIYIIKHLGIYLGVWSWLYANWLKFNEVGKSWCMQRYDALVPVPIRGLYKFSHILNVNLKKNLKGGIDTVASCVVIFGLLIFVLCASIFVAVQIYTEAIMLVQMTSNVINQTVVHNPELRLLLPPTFDDTVDSVLDNAYQYGREGISKVIRGMVSDVDSAQSVKLEKQVLELWDRLYQTWMQSDSLHGPKVTSTAVQNSWNSFMDDIQKYPEMFNIQGITEFVKQNIGTFMSLLDSVWTLLKGNISLVLNSFSAFLSILLGGGTAVLNFILNVIVFLTTLFYLLNSSGDLYKPVEIMTNFSSSGSRFGLALEGAINGVFTATFKMAAFYGMWTWFIHNWFNVKIVYVPSALAAILGAVPFLGTYWACIPAVLDLWLAQGKGFHAILIAVFQFLPTSIVDTTIYNEIQGGGHPYLTGLAIAGGIFCLGVEGAILGPLLLCALYVAMDLSSSYFRDSPTDDINVRNIPSLK